MKQLIPYINFFGRCKEALDFYQTCFENAELSIQYLGDGRVDDVPQDMKEGVMHAEF